jgi:hypothetical protein
MVFTIMAEKVRMSLKDALKLKGVCRENYISDEGKKRLSNARKNIPSSNTRYSKRNVTLRVLAQQHKHLMPPNAV